MIIRRIAATAAAAVALLAVAPGVARASSAGTSPRPAPARCKVTVVGKHGGGPVTAAGCCAVLIKAHPVTIKGHPVTIKRKPVTIARALPASCGSRPVTFDMPAFSRTATEVSGPHLTTHELFIYDGRIFTIASVQGSAFTLDRLPAVALKRFPAGGKPVPVSRKHLTAVKPAPFTNGATAITDGHARVLGGPAVIAISVKR
jgi:hypothetical protein